jgi:hypothetical protein
VWLFLGLDLASALSGRGIVAFPPLSKTNNTYFVSQHFPEKTIRPRTVGRSQRFSAGSAAQQTANAPGRMMNSANRDQYPDLPRITPLITNTSPCCDSFVMFDIRR